MEISSHDAKLFYRKMVLIRSFELRTTEIFASRMKAGDFPGALHSSEGQEAVAVGVCVVSSVVSCLLSVTSHVHPLIL